MPLLANRYPGGPYSDDPVPPDVTTNGGEIVRPVPLIVVAPSTVRFPTRARCNLLEDHPPPNHGSHLEFFRKDSIY